MPGAASVCKQHLHSLLIPGICLGSSPTLTSYLFNRGSANEEVAPLGEGPSDDDVAASTSSSGEEDEDDSSSISSKGDPEQPEESAVRRGDTVYDLWL